MDDGGNYIHGLLRQVCEAALAQAGRFGASTEFPDEQLLQLIMSSSSSDRMVRPLARKLLREVRPIVKEVVASSRGTVDLEALLARPDLERLCTDTMAEVKGAAVGRLEAAAREGRELSAVLESFGEGEPDYDEDNDHSDGDETEGRLQGGGGGFVSIFSLHDVPDVAFVDPNSLSTQLHDPQPHVRIAALTNMEKMSLSELIYTPQWPAICEGLAWLLAHGEQPEVELRVIKLVNEMATVFTPTQIADLYLTLTLDLARCFRCTARLLPLEGTFDIASSGDLRTIWPKVHALHRLQLRIGDLFIFLPEMTSCKILSWTLVLLRSIEYPCGPPTVPMRPDRPAACLSVSHLLSCLDPEVTWFRQWCLRIPSPQLRHLLRQTGLDEDLIHRCERTLAIAPTSTTRSATPPSTSKRSTCPNTRVIHLSGSAGPTTSPTAATTAGLDSRLSTSSLWMLCHALDVFALDLSDTKQSCAVHVLGRAGRSLTPWEVPDVADVELTPDDASTAHMYSLSVKRTEPDVAAPVQQVRQESRSATPTWRRLVSILLHCLTRSRPEGADDTSVRRAACQGLLRAAECIENMSDDHDGGARTEVLLQIFTKLTTSSLNHPYVCEAALGLGTFLLAHIRPPSSAPDSLLSGLAAALEAALAILSSTSAQQGGACGSNSLSCRLTSLSQAACMHYPSIYRDVHTHATSDMSSKLHLHIAASLSGARQFLSSSTSSTARVWEFLAREVNPRTEGQEVRDDGMAINSILHVVQTLASCPEGVARLTDSGILRPLTGFMSICRKMYGVRLPEYLSCSSKGTIPRQLYMGLSVMLCASYGIGLASPASCSASPLPQLLQECAACVINGAEHGIADEDVLYVALRVMFAAASTLDGVVLLRTRLPTLTSALTHLLRGPSRTYVDEISIGATYLNTLLTQCCGPGEQTCTFPPLPPVTAEGQLTSSTATAGVTSGGRQPGSSRGHDHSQYAPSNSPGFQDVVAGLDADALLLALADRQAGSSTRALIDLCWQALVSRMQSSADSKEVSAAAHADWFRENHIQHREAEASVCASIAAQYATQLKVLQTADALAFEAAVRRVLVHVPREACWLAATLMIMSRGAETSVLALLHNAFKNHRGSGRREATADAVAELTACELPQVHSALTVAGVSCHALVDGWLRQCFWRVMDFREVAVCATLRLCIGPDLQACVALALLRHLQAPVVAATAAQKQFISFVELPWRAPPMRLDVDVAKYVIGLRQKYGQWLQVRLAAATTD